MNKLMAFVLLGLLLAPVPRALALNHQTKQCAGFWGGDEWAHYDLPSGWKAYYPDHDFVQTEVGSCQLSGEWKASVEKCCKELGYTYVSDNIGTQTGLPAAINILTVIVIYFLGPFLPILLVLGVLAGVLVLFVRGRRVEPSHIENPNEQTPPTAEPLLTPTAVAPFAISGGKFVRCPNCNTKNYATSERCEKCGIRFLAPIQKTPSHPK